jgi:hypothetical protein
VIPRTSKTQLQIRAPSLARSQSGTALQAVVGERSEAARSLRPHTHSPSCLLRPSHHDGLKSRPTLASRVVLSWPREMRRPLLISLVPSHHPHRLRRREAPSLSRRTFDVKRRTLDIAPKTPIPSHPCFHHLRSAIHTATHFLPPSKCSKPASLPHR